MDDKPEFEKNLRLALDYVERYVAPDGEVITDSYDMWLLEDGTTLSEYGNLYNLLRPGHQSSPFDLPFRHL